MKDIHFAQFNIGICRYDLEDPRMADFTNNFETVYAIADAQPGMVWRQPSAGAEGDINATPIYDDRRIVVSMSIWKTVKDFYDFAYNTGHTAYLKRRKEWFIEFPKGVPHQVIWWIRAGDIPTALEGKARLEYIEKNGPTPYGFGFRDKFEFDPKYLELPDIAGAK
jgi:hypothetical protein